jgi:hypothetical protein
MNDREIVEGILRIIAGDDVLTEQFAASVGMSTEEFSEWINKVQIPDFTLARQKLLRN